MKKITLAIIIIFILFLTSCLSQKYVEETYEIKKSIQKTEIKPIQKLEKPHSQKTDYEIDIKQFGYPNDVSTYSSDGYYSKTCTWYNSCGKYRSYDYDMFGKRTSKFESNPIR